MFSSPREMYNLIKEKLAAPEAATEIRDMEVCPWWLATYFLVKIINSKLQTVLGVVDVARVPGVSTLWELVLASLFAHWVSMPANMLFKPKSSKLQIKGSPHIIHKIENQPKKRCLPRHLEVHFQGWPTISHFSYKSFCPAPTN